MSDPMITAYSWAAGIFQQTLPPSLIDAEKRAQLVYEINTALVKGKNAQENLEEFTSEKITTYVNKRVKFLRTK